MKNTAFFNPIKNNTLVYYGYVVIVVLFISAVCYGILPMFGIEQFKNLLAINHIWAFCGLLIAGALYWVYTDFFAKHVAFFTLVFVVFYDLGHYLLRTFSQSVFELHSNLLTLVFFAIPAILTAIQNWRSVVYMWQKIPHFKTILFFAALIIFYFLFNNQNAIEGIYTDPDKISDGSHAFHQTYTITFFACSLMLIGVTFKKIESFTQFFDRLNRVYLVLIISASAIVIISYPFNAFTMVVDGFKRATFIYGHPNPYSHYMAIMELYVLGLLFYYQKIKTVSIRLILVTLVIGFSALVLGLSKTALGLFSFCTALLVILNLSLDKSSRAYSRYFIYLIVIFMVSLSAIQALGIANIIQLITNRLENQDSLNWRLQTWHILTSEINGEALFTGHGLTASMIAIRRLYFNPYAVLKGNLTSIQAHNAFLETFYDFGILGLCWIFGLLLSLKNIVIKAYQSESGSPNKPLYILMLCMALYFLGTCYFDVIFYADMYPFWSLFTILYLMTLKVPPHDYAI